MSLRSLLPDPAPVLARWPDAPQVHHRGVTDLDHLCSHAAVMAYIDSDCLVPDQVVVINDGAIIDRSRFSRDGRLVTGALRQQLAFGHTLSIRNLQQVIPGIAAICRGIQAETGYPAHASAYLTPPGSRGLGPHWDPYTVVVAQISGVKTWPLYRPTAVNPTSNHLKFSSTGFTDEQRKTVTDHPPDQSVTLRPGDTLIVPRGWIHRPHAEGDVPSLHITIATRELTRHWLAVQVVAKAITEDAFREALPPLALTGDMTTEVETVRTLLTDHLAALDPAVFAALARQAALSMPLAP